jgi:hypothetical protein
VTGQHEMVMRVSAAQATVDRFVDTPFAWGSVDCVKMLAFHLRQLGYRPLLSKGGAYRSALTARRALKRAGYDALANALDGLSLPRIAPAAAIVGDIVSGAADDPLGALGIVLGNGRIFGFSEEAPGAVVMQQVAMDMAWRASPWPNS